MARRVSKGRLERQRLRKAAKEARRTSRAKGKRIRQWLWVGLIAFVGLLVIIGFGAGSGIMQSLRPPPQTGATGPGERIPVLRASHVPTGQAVETYNSVPPTSGPHWSDPARWGIYQEELRDEQVVHNLEHGGVVFNYNTEDTQVLQQLEELVLGLPNSPCFLLMQPYSRIEEGSIVLTAWGVLERFEEFDEARMLEFANAYRDRGPERVACNPADYR